MDKLVHEYLDTSRALQQKYDELKFGKLVKHEERVERYQPIVEPLVKLNERLATVSEDSTDNPVATKFLNLIHSKSVLMDNNYGIHEEPGKGLYIGNQPIEVLRNGDVKFINTDTVYTGTPGLWELLTMAKPKNYTEDDMKTYKQIILQSNVHKRSNDPSSSRLKSNRSYKYRTIIKPLLDDDDRENLSTIFKTGSGLRKISINRPVEYVYWNTLEELLDRLCILYGELKSGNTNPLISNEIVNILQEIKEI